MLLFLRHPDLPGVQAGLVKAGVVEAFGGRGYHQSLLGRISATHSARMSLALRDLAVADPSGPWLALSDATLDSVIARLDDAGFVREGFDRGC